MYPYVMITPSLVRQIAEESLKGYGPTKPMPDEYWYKTQAPKPKRRVWSFWSRAEASRSQEVRKSSLQSM